jgi:hypothetical protein
MVGIGVDETQTGPSERTTGMDTYPAPDHYINSHLETTCLWRGQ